jgi:hypothetical protein
MDRFNDRFALPPAHPDAGLADGCGWLTHHVHILEMNGDSYRLKQSKRRQRVAEVVNSPDE